MKVKIEVMKDATWLVTPLEGSKAYKPIASVEGIQLENVTFLGGYIMGTPTAVWGATLFPSMESDSACIRGLGVGRSFHAFRGTRASLRMKGWVDAETNVEINRCRDVSVFRAGVFYR